MQTYVELIQNPPEPYDYPHPGVRITHRKPSKTFERLTGTRSLTGCYNVWHWTKHKRIFIYTAYDEASRTAAKVAAEDFARDVRRRLAMERHEREWRRAEKERHSAYLANQSAPTN